MFKNLRDRIVLSGFTVLMIGVALLIFTFVSAYGFLVQGLVIPSSADLAQTFGEALAPLIATCIRIMYLGVMAWIGSLLTIRGVTIINRTPSAASQKAMEQEQKSQPEKVQSEKLENGPKKLEAKPLKRRFSEPELVVMEPEQVSQLQFEPE